MIRYARLHYTTTCLPNIAIIITVTCHHLISMIFITAPTTLHCTTLPYTTLPYTTLHYTTLHYTTLHYTTLHYTMLHSTTLHYTTLHSTTLHSPRKRRKILEGMEKPNFVAKILIIYTNWYACFQLTVWPVLLNDYFERNGYYWYH